jgi:hypothetical protein
LSRPNFRALGAFRLHITRLWRRVLQRRSQKDGATWKRIEKLADAFLPKPRILHPWPSDRFAIKPEVGAVCGKSARTDLSGGRPVMDVPTAILLQLKTPPQKAWKSTPFG